MKKTQAQCFIKQSSFPWAETTLPSAYEKLCR